MDVTEIPLVKHLGIEEHEGELSLAFKKDILNHVETIHAAAQYALAETQSGLHLLELFPELEDKVIPILRDAQIKYKKPAQAKIVALASCDAESVEKFKTQFENKGRGTLQIDAQIKDINDVITCQASFTWFVQSL